MTRTALALALPALLGACKHLSFPIAEDFRLLPKKAKYSAEPVAGAVELSGRAKMQSGSAFGPVDNSFVDVEGGLNMGDRDTLVGGRVAYDDGFAGVSAAVFHYKTRLFKSPGELVDDFGNLNVGDKVFSESRYTHFRLDWVLPLVARQGPGKVDLLFGAGLSVQHDEFKLDAHNEPKTRRQVLTFKDTAGVPKILLRGEARWSSFKLRGEFAWMSGDFGGINGALLDFGASLHYQVQRGISAWAGYWRHNLPGEGEKDGLGFEFDMSVQGYVAGIRYVF